MGIADRYIEYRDNERRNRFTMGQPGNALIAILALNIVFFLFIMASHVFVLYTHQGQGMDVLKFDAIDWFALPAQLNHISERPWTLLSFMFSLGGQPPLTLLLNMLSNMLWLYAFGYILQTLAGNELIFPVYIYGSIAGAVFFVAANYTIPALHEQQATAYLTGSNTGTAALAVAVATLSPRFKLFKNLGGGIPVWIMSGLFILFSLANTLGKTNANSAAIIGGALAGFLFVWFMRKGFDGSIWMNRAYHGCMNLFNPDKNSGNRSVKENMFYDAGKRTPFTKTATLTQQRVDEILDKISQKGYEFLTKEEKEILKRASEEEL